MNWSVLVVWANGTQEYVTTNNDEIAMVSKRTAKELAASFRMGFDEGEIQSINVVPAPRGALQAAMKGQNA